MAGKQTEEEEEEENKWRAPTLGADEDERDFANVAKLRHFRVVVVDGVETGLVLQTEDEDDRVHPRRKLWQRQSTNKR